MDCVWYSSTEYLVTDTSRQLFTAKANTIWRESETMITRLITNAIGTGATVAVCGLITIVLFVTSPEDSLQYLSA